MKLVHGDEYVYYIVVVKKKTSTQYYRARPETKCFWNNYGQMKLIRNHRGFFRKLCRFTCRIPETAA